MTHLAISGVHPVTNAQSARWAGKFGWGSRAELEQQLASALARLSEVHGGVTSADSEQICLQLERAHAARFGWTALRAEFADERERDLAMVDESRLVSYQGKWEKKLSKLQRAHPQRWRVRGLSDEEARDLLTLRLIEAVRTEAETHQRYSRPGREWALGLFQHHLLELRKRFRLEITATNFDDAPFCERRPSQEERCLELEAERRRAAAGFGARQTLSRPQRRWLAALEQTAAQGNFFRASDELNLSAASRVLGKSRSAASRAYRELQTHFMRELARSE